MDDWQTHALCLTANPDLFFDLRDPDPALEYCAHCPVIAHCRMYMRRLRPEYGVWAGLVVNPKVKQCGGCGDFLPTSAFTPGQPGRDGSRTYCKDCHRVKSREYRTRRKELANN